MDDDLSKLPFVPQAAGYAIAPPIGEVIGEDVPGGLPGLEADIEGGCSVVDVSFVFDAGDWQVYCAFKRNRTANGAEPFLCDLILDGSDIAEFTVMLVPNSEKTTAVAQIRYVSAQYYVLPAEVDEDFDSSLVDLYEASDGDMRAYMDLLVAAVAAFPE